MLDPGRQRDEGKQAKFTWAGSLLALDNSVIGAHGPPLHCCSSLN